ncbi:MAG: Wzz/FepE/Etk N-terminal domain-containing protein [Pseudomonadota bacterium]
MLSIDNSETRSRKLAWTGFGLNDVVLALTAHWPRIVILACLALALAIVVILLTPRTYSATARVVFDPTSAIILSRDSNWLQPNLETTMRMESQVEVVRSVTVAKRVIDKLNLVKDDELKKQPSLIGWVQNLLTGGNVQVAAGSVAGAANDPEIESVLPNFLNRLSASRVGRSTVIEIGFWSRNPKKAVRIANAIADSYREFDLSQKAKILKQGSDWLQLRVDQLREKVIASQLEVERFKRRGQGSISGSVVTMAGLESEAKTFRRMYEAAHLQLMDTTQKVSYPITDIRTLSTASVSTVASSPKTKLIIAFSAMLGAALGVLITVGRLSQDGVVRTQEDLSLQGQPSLGRIIAKDKSGLRGSKLGGRFNPLAKSAAEANLGRDAKPEWKKVASATGAYLFHPSFLQRIIPAAPGQLQGVFSMANAAPSQATCLGLGTHYASLGHKVLIVEAHGSTLAPGAGSAASDPNRGVKTEPDNPEGVPSVISAGGGIDRVVAAEARKRLRTAETRAALFDWVREAYDVCLFDFGPVASGTHLELFAGLFSDALLVIQENSVTQPEVANAVATLRDGLGMPGVGLVLQQGFVRRAVHPTSSGGSARICGSDDAASRHKTGDVSPYDVVS